MDGPSPPIFITGWCFQPLRKIWVRQLGWWNSQYFWENKQKWQPNHQPDKARLAKTHDFICFLKLESYSWNPKQNLAKKNLTFDERQKITIFLWVFMIKPSRYDGWSFRNPTWKTALIQPSENELRTPSPQQKGGALVIFHWIYI